MASTGLDAHDSRSRLAYRSWRIAPAPSTHKRYERANTVGPHSRRPAVRRPRVLPRRAVRTRAPQGLFRSADLPVDQHALATRRLRGDAGSARTTSRDPRRGGPPRPGPARRQAPPASRRGAEHDQPAARAGAASIITPAHPRRPGGPGACGAAHPGDQPAGHGTPGGPSRRVGRLRAGGGSSSTQLHGTVMTVRGMSSSTDTCRALASPPTTTPDAPAGIQVVCGLAMGIRS